MAQARLSTAIRGADRPGDPPSPMDELIAEAQSQGYSRTQGVRAPYHGYYYKMLTKQGPHANGGANYEGVVFSKNLGASTAKIAGAMTRFDPDWTWTKEGQD